MSYMNNGNQIKDYHEIAVPNISPLAPTSLPPTPEIEIPLEDLDAHSQGMVIKAAAHVLAQTLYEEKFKHAREGIFRFVIEGTQLYVEVSYHLDTIEQWALGSKYPERLLTVIGKRRDFLEQAMDTLEVMLFKRLCAEAYKSLQPSPMDRRPLFGGVSLRFFTIEKTDIKTDDDEPDRIATSTGTFFGTSS